MVNFQRAFVELAVVDKGDNISNLLSSHTSQLADCYQAKEYDNLEGMTSSYMTDIQKWCELYHSAICLGERNGPLVPLQTKQKVAWQITTLALSGSEGPPAANVVADILKNLGETVYQAGLQELKSHAMKEIWEAVNSSLEKMVSDGSLSQGSALPSRSNLLPHIFCASDQLQPTQCHQPKQL